MMDAATLFVVLKLASGQEKTITKPYATVLSCEVAAQELRDTAPPVHWDVERTVYCKPHMKIAPR